MGARRNHPAACDADRDQCVGSRATPGGCDVVLRPWQLWDECGSTADQLATQNEWGAFAPHSRYRTIGELARTTPTELRALGITEKGCEALSAMIGTYGKTFERNINTSHDKGSRLSATFSSAPAQSEEEREMVSIPQFVSENTPSQFVSENAPSTTMQAKLNAIPAGVPGMVPPPSHHEKDPNPAGILKRKPLSLDGVKEKKRRVGFLLDEHIDMERRARGERGIQEQEGMESPSPTQKSLPVPDAATVVHEAAIVQEAANGHANVSTNRESSTIIPTDEPHEITMLEEEATNAEKRKAEDLFLQSFIGEKKQKCET